MRSIKVQLNSTHHARDCELGALKLGFRLQDSTPRKARESYGPGRFLKTTVARLETQQPSTHSTPDTRTPPEIFLRFLREGTAISLSVYRRHAFVYHLMVPLLKNRIRCSLLWDIDLAILNRPRMRDSAPSQRRPAEASSKQRAANQTSETQTTNAPDSRPWFVMKCPLAYSTRSDQV